ncbi:SDR family oxidoreductase [Guyparkeria hydrothermalis]|uniref:UDP-glucose 4-epimerase family protein n=1 Tax=Guyparkeria hydrothermalis TaxID=923 RepID=UPI0020214918|nr:SDR family oxidoreductase [Guyparkeria hydrothermalis]MCL7743689.1 SDR family oxidoreductase [Guyparkeria hydrothermalis]
MPDTQHVLVTGANGFVGSRLIERLGAVPTYTVSGAVRQVTEQSAEGGRRYAVGSLNAQTDWRSALAGTDVVVHTAARAHVMADATTDPLSEYRRVNVDGTRVLARQAAEQGVRRFVFISSVKVNGERTETDARFSADDEPSPRDAYGVSKFEAEQALREICSETGMEIVIIRPPLVYGPGVKGNFASMMRWVQKGVPLPLGAVNNRRSLVALDNVVDLVTTCIDHPAAANEVFLVSDGEDLSTTDLLRRVGKAMNRPARLISVPTRLLAGAAAMLGKRDVARRLLGSLQVDISKTRDVLGWEPPISVDEGLRRAVEPLTRL